VCLFLTDEKAHAVNADLDSERKKAGFDVESLSLFLYGDLLQKKRAAGLLVEH